MKKIKVLDLFCGIGGFSYGFEMTKKFEVSVGADIWDVALNTFRKNHSSTKLINEDLTKTTNEFWEEYTGKIDVIIAGPPCQGFSMSGKREIGDKRNSLFEEVVRITRIIQPKYIVIENVVGLLSMENLDGKLVKDLIIEEFNNLGYKTDYKILNAADFGVPQARRRVVFMISKNYEISFPQAKFHEQNYVTVGDALGNIPPYGTEYEEPKTDYQLLMQGPKKIENHKPKKHNELIEKRMSYIPQGGNWQNIPIELGQGGGTHSNAYKRLDSTKPAVTMKHAGKAMIIHPYVNRVLTIREVARLQSFDDSFVLTGGISDQHQQLANAVPPLLGKAIAEEIYKNLCKGEKNEN